MALYIGLMSGTSVDGIDAILVDFTKDAKPRIIATKVEPWTDDESNQINKLCIKGDNEIHRAGIVGNMYALKCASLVKDILTGTGLKAADITAIASHGQTIRHEPNNGFSVQIGNHARLAALTGINVVCDFRSMDLACGGQGAPLVPAFHSEICAVPDRNRFIVNIGGIANVTALIPGKPIIGFDTGPGNTLLDLLARSTINKKCDVNGTISSSGNINQGMVNIFLNDPYFEQKPPKSTGRELFNGAFLNKCQTMNLISVADRFATIAEVTALSIVNGINSLGAKGEIFICGGGVHNNHLMHRIEYHAKKSGHSLVAPISALGIDPDFLEAFAFAWLGYKFMNHECLDLHCITGAKIPSILGCFYPHP